MKTQTHALTSQSVGTRRELISLHYGQGAVDTKVYLQASLHADEVPGMLVLHHLRGLLDQAEGRGEIVGRVSVVPCANPIGLSQHLMRDHLGRYDFNSGENFNRAFPDFFDLIISDIEARLCDDLASNKRFIREAVRTRIRALNDGCTTELDSLRYLLLELSHDADYVLDLHCDFEALPHLYADTPYLPQAELLSCYLGVQTLLHAKGSGGSAFDEAQSGVWYRLQEQFGDKYPVPLSGCGVTVELRGEADVSHAYASKDAQNIFAWMQRIGVIAGTPPETPKPEFIATPLAGCESLIAPVSGILVYLIELGAMVAEEDVVAEIIDPMTQNVSLVRANVAGKFFARENRRFAVSGMSIGKIAGETAYKHGPLLGA